MEHDSVQSDSSFNPIFGYLDDVKECTAEIAVHLGDTEIFSMLKFAPPKEQADELMQSVWFDAGRPMIERLVQAGADLNAYDPKSGTSEPDSLRHHFYRGETKLVMEVIPK